MSIPISISISTSISTSTSTSISVPISILPFQYCLVILSFQYCPFSTVFSALSFHPHKPLRVHRSTSGWWSCRELIIAVPAFKCRAAAAAALRCRCAAAAAVLRCCCAVLAALAAAVLQGCRADDYHYHYHHHYQYHYHFFALFSNPPETRIIRGAAARAVRSTRSRADPTSVKPVNLGLWKPGAATCKRRRHVSRGQG